MPIKKYLNQTFLQEISEQKKDKDVRGVIIAGQYDKKLDYAREMIPNVEVFIYQVDFKLSEFK